MVRLPTSQISKKGARAFKGRLFFACLALASAILAAGASAQGQRPTRKLDEAPLRPLMAQGVEAVKARKPAEAIRLFEEIDRKFSAAYANGPRVFCSRGPQETVLYLSISAAEKTNAVAISPLWCDAIYLKAYSLVELKRPAEAAKELDRVLKLAPNNSQYLNERAELYTRARNFDAALAMFKQAEHDSAFAPNPQAATAFKSRGCRGVGYVLVELGKLDEAEANYRRCLSIDPKDRKSFRELGYIAAKKAERK